MEPMKSFLENQPDNSLAEFLATSPGSKDYFLAGARTSGYFGDLMKRNSPKFTGIAGITDGKNVAWLLAKRLLKVQSRFLMKIPAADFKRSIHQSLSLLSLCK